MAAYEDGETVEWEVAWFPPDSDKTMTTTEEAKAWRKYETERENGSNPIISKRTVVATPWSIVANAVSPR